ncbi:hypothetical protein KFE98_19320 [bacterium SCSIO 12741]|nr:hypothetical protein KFE98_19320 [bacterium SCSIO 12741]
MFALVAIGIAPIHAQQLHVGFFNDSQNGGIGANKDDYRSFGFDAQFQQKDKLSFGAFYSGLTHLSWGIPPKAVA